MMKYFIYYSTTGNGDFIASKLKEAGYEIIKVETIKPMGKMSFFKMLKYGGDSMFNKKAKIKPIDLSIKDDDVVAIGSPIWNDRLSTPINAILSQFVFNKDSTKFVLYPAGDSAKKAIKQLEKQGFKNSPFVFTYPLKNEQRIKEVIDYLK